MGAHGGHQYGGKQILEEKRGQVKDSLDSEFRIDDAIPVTISQLLRNIYDSKDVNNRT